MTNTPQIILELREATKKYAGVPAIDAVNFQLYRGEIHALLGENGAGKSTLTKVMAGVVQLTSGEMLIEDRPVNLRTPLESHQNGIAMVFQETSLVPTMTVAQNLFLGQEKFFNRLRGIYISAQQFLQSLNFDVDPTATVSLLGAAKKQMVEIARAVLNDARIIIFDEPTASLTPEEKKYFFDLVLNLKARGVSVVFISHALEEALLLADRITVLRDGQHVVTDLKENFDRARIVQAMVGRDLSQTLYGQKKAHVRPPGECVLSVRNLRMASMVKNNSLSVFARASHGGVWPGGRGTNRDLQGGGGLDQARLLPWWRSLAQRQTRTLSRGTSSDTRRHRLHHRRPQGGGLFRNHVHRPKYLHGLDGQGGQCGGLGVASQDAVCWRPLDQTLECASHQPGCESD
jgi:simple sugar transport system ATP-binding protein